jgi:hypothetical protein
VVPVDAGAKPVSVELAGGGRNAPLFSELAARHGAPDASIALILTSGSRAKYVSYRELVTQEGGFRGEEAVTSALIEVTDVLTELGGTSRRTGAGIIFTHGWPHCWTFDCFCFCGLLGHGFLKFADHNLSPIS